MRRSSIATSLLGLAGLALATLTGQAALTGSGRLPAAFADSVADSAYRYPYAHAGETLWLGLPPMPMKLHQPIRITGVQVHGRVAGATFAFFDMSLDGANGGRHVGTLTDHTFRSAGFQLGPRLIGTIFRPGSPTHYALIRMTLNAPGSYEIDSVTLTYKSSSGATGSQVITDTFQDSTCDNRCPAWDK